MSEELKPFEGATHARIVIEGEKVRVVEYLKITKWSKDGDHPKVERYPIEGRMHKGLLRVGPKEKYHLAFNDWIFEDAKGRIWVEPHNRANDVLPAHYVPVEKVPSLLPSVAALLIAVLIALFAPSSDFPVVFAVTHLMYYSALLGQWNGTANAVFDLDEAADDMKVSIHTNTYTVNQDTHDFFDDVTNEVSGTNYTAGGTSIANQLLSRSTNTVTFDGDDIVWSQSGAGFSNGRKFVIRRNNGGVASTSRLFSVVTADNDVGNVTGDLTLAFNASGIATWSTT